MSLTYWGSKKKLAGDIADIICTADARDYYEPFCGMAHVGLEIAKRGCFRKYQFSDVDDNVILYLDAILRGWLPPIEPITPAQWNAFRNTRKRSVKRSFYGMHLGWGGHFLAGTKLHEQRNKTAAYRRVRDRIKRAVSELQDEDINFHTSSFHTIRPTTGAVIYCDPPYMSDSVHSERHFNHAQMGALWESMRTWIVRYDCVVYLSASKRPGPPPGMRTSVVKRWNVTNNSASMHGGTMRRQELLLRVLVS